MNRNSTPSEIWQELPTEIKSSATACFFKPFVDKEKAPSEELALKAVGLISYRLKIRPKSVSKYSDLRKAQLLSSIVSLPDELVVGVIRAYLLSDQVPMLSAFLDSLCVKHKNGRIENEADLESLTGGKVEAAGKKLLTRFDREMVELYFWALIESDDVWEVLRVNPLDSSLQVDAPARPEQEDFDQEIAIHEQGFTSLDNLITLAIIDAAAEVHGSFSRDQVLDIVDEVLHLNARRHQSYFHRGYAEAIFDLDLQLHFGEENPSRRLWYLSGAIVAYARKENHAKIAALYDSEDIVILGHKPDARARVAALFVFDSLCLTGRGTSAAAFLSPQLIPFLDSFDHVLELGTKLLRTGEIENADALLTLLHASRAFFPEAELSTDRESKLKRRRAHCLRLKHQFSEAQRLLEELVQESDEEKSAILTDLAMVSASFRGLVDIEIPEKNAVSFINRLNKISDALVAAVGGGGDPSHAEFCLGVLSLAESSTQAAATLLERAVTQMMSRSDVYNYGDLLARARFYLALALAETLDESRSKYSVQLFNESLRLGHVPVTGLLRRYIEALLMVNPEEARLCAERILPDVQLGPKVLEALAATDVLRKSAPILNALYKWSCEPSRSKKTRFDDLKIVLRESLFARDIDLAEKALDQMEILARTSGYGKEYAALLEDPAHYDPAWMEADAAWSAVRVLETLGEYQRASDLLIREFHRVLTSDEFGATDEAAEILLKIRSYGLTTVDVGSLDSRLAAATIKSDENLPQRHNKPKCITIVGGDELESSYDEAIRKWCKHWDPFLDIHFRHTNWSSNHGEQLDSMKALINRSDAVVVMRRIRTNLGRNVRSVSKLWIGCAGESKSSIQRAIMTASQILATQDAKTNLN
jgi:hypothetical protein